MKIKFMVHKYDLHIIQEQVCVKSTKIFRCTMVTRTPRIRCLAEAEAAIVKCSLKVPFIFKQIVLPSLIKLINHEIGTAR